MVVITSGALGCGEAARQARSSAWWQPHLYAGGRAHPGGLCCLEQNPQLVSALKEVYLTCKECLMTRGDLVSLGLTFLEEAALLSGLESVWPLGDCSKLRSGESLTLK